MLDSEGSSLLQVAVPKRKKKKNKENKNDKNNKRNTGKDNKEIALQEDNI